MFIIIICEGYCQWIKETGFFPSFGKKLYRSPSAEQQGKKMKNRIIAARHSNQYGRKIKTYHIAQQKKLDFID